MRKIATVKQAGDAVRVMLYASGSGVYLFLYESQEDGPCTADYWFESAELAEQSALEDYGVATSDWQTIPDPLDGCQHDWIAPTRVRRDATGQPMWGHFERVQP
jgi:biofilm protein TabA